MANQVNRPRGTVDILPGEIEKWQYIEEKARNLCKNFNYREIRTPIFEHTELFERGVGDQTDIVQKEMYTFKDRGDRSVTLRPEGTASVVRAFVENKLYGANIKTTKLYYIGPMFRHERPQAGRQRQFVQFGVEAIGSNDPAVDAEIIALAMSFYQDLGLKGLKLVVNSLGDFESRQAYRQALISHFEPVIGNYCSDCQKRLQSNPLRILDCKVDREQEEIQSAPKIGDFYSSEARVFFDKVCTYLDTLKIPYTIDPTLVRGLDYYNHTAFEIMLEGKGFGAITTLCGGGRYNQLIEELGGPDTPGIGFALSIERVLMALQSEGIDLNEDQGMDCFLISMGEDSREKIIELAYLLRQNNLSCELDYMGRKVKTMFKEAERLGARYALVLGENELTEGVIQVKDLKTGEQEMIPFNKLVEKLKKRKEGEV